MELTAHTINEAEFSMARRGYDPDQVDEFLEKLAVAVDKQNEALAEARQQAAAAERRAADAERKLAERPERVVGAGAPAGAPGPAPVPAGRPQAEVAAAAEAELETLKRTLVLAQKTADATVREAEEDARRLIAAAENEAKAAQESTRVRLLDEIAKLDANRTALHGDISAMEHYLEEQRLRLRDSIADLQRLLEDRLKPVPAPQPSVPAAAPPSIAPAASQPAWPEAERGPALDKQPPAPPALPAGGGAPASGPFTSQGGDRQRIVAADDRRADSEADEAWARFDDADDVDAGPPTQPVLRLDDFEADLPLDAGSDDAYLSELRKAIIDDTGAPDVADAYGDDAPRSRFGRRR